MVGAQRGRKMPGGRIFLSSNKSCSKQELCLASVALTSLSMRDADDDEETRVFSANADTALASSSPSVARAEGLPPPRLDDGALPAARAVLAPSKDEEEPTRLATAAPTASPQKWLVSDGPNAPVDLTHSELRAALSSGKVSPAALAWQKGMREWQKISDIATLKGALPRSSPRSSPPPKRTSRPRTEPGAARRSKPVNEPPVSALAGALSADASAAFDSTEADTPPSGSALLSASISSADFSEVTPAHTPQSQRAQMLAAEASRTNPERIEVVLPPAGAAKPGSAGKLSNKPQPSIHTPRPAAGRPPAPGEPVAKTPEAPDAVGAPAAPPKVVINEPPAAVLAHGRAQAQLKPTIETQREATEPARWRPPLGHRRAAGQPPNVVLWVLGAGGWVLSGVLAGILIAKNHPEPTGVSTTVTTSDTHALLPREPSEQAARRRLIAAPATPEHAAAAPSETDVPGALAQRPDRAPSEAGTQASPTAGATPVPSPGVVSRPVPPLVLKPTPTATTKTLNDPSGLSNPTSTKDINTPGF